MVSKFSKERIQQESSWWKDSEEQHYTIVKNVEGGENQKSFSQVVTESLQRLPPTTMKEPPKLNRNLSIEGGKGM